jgi:hypothetical protein
MSKPEKQAWGAFKYETQTSPLVDIPTKPAQNTGSETVDVPGAEQPGGFDPGKFHERLLGNQTAPELQPSKPGEAPASVIDAELSASTGSLVSEAYIYLMEKMPPLGAKLNASAYNRAQAKANKIHPFAEEQMEKIRQDVLRIHAELLNWNEKVYDKFRFTDHEKMRRRALFIKVFQEMGIQIEFGAAGELAKTIISDSYRAYDNMRELQASASNMADKFDAIISRLEAYDTSRVKKSESEEKPITVPVEDEKNP